MSTLRTPAARFIYLVIGSAVLLGGWTLATLPTVTPEQGFFFVIFSLLACIAYLHPIRLGDDPTAIVVANAFLFAGAVRFPPGLVTLMCLALLLTGALTDNRVDRWLRAGFNAANYLLATMAAALLLRAAGWAGLRGPDDLLVLLAAITADVALGTVLVGWFLALNAQASSLQSSIWDWRVLAVDWLISAVGALVGIVSLAVPWALGLVLIPLILPYWLLRGIHLVRMVDVDPKTSLYNHRYLQSALREHLARHKAGGDPVSILFADLDYLREVNNRYGHLAGDRVLQQVAELLRQNTRPGDLIARWGGEEFVLILPRTPLPAAAAIAERLCQAIADHTFDVGLAEGLRCSISIGVSGAAEHGADPEQLIHSADQAMYQAKAKGRNRVVVAPGPG